jgi:hypothetical protein
LIPQRNRNVDENGKVLRRLTLQHVAWKRLNGIIIRGRSSGTSGPNGAPWQESQQKHRKDNV